MFWNKKEKEKEKEKEIIINGIFCNTIEIFTPDVNKKFTIDLKNCEYTYNEDRSDYTSDFTVRIEDMNPIFEFIEYKGLYKLEKNLFIKLDGVMCEFELYPEYDAKINGKLESCYFWLKIKNTNIVLVFVYDSTKKQKEEELNRAIQIRDKVAKKLGISQSEFNDLMLLYTKNNHQ